MESEAQKKPTLFIRYGLLVFLILSISFCKWIRLETEPEPPKQGDLLTITITAGESSQVQEINYRINNQTGTATVVPFTIQYDTCKRTGDYHTSLELWGEVIYQDNTRKSFNKTYDLTTGNHSREDNDSEYSVYVAHGSNKAEELLVGMANKFINNFDSYDRSQYYWAEEFFFTSSAITYANSADLLLIFGHGGPHSYKVNSSSTVTLSGTEYGNFTPCHFNGDLEYLAIIGCNMLSMEWFANVLLGGGSGWGSSAYATSIAFGDVDGDGLDEVGIARKHGSNERYWILDDANHNFATLFRGGSGWGSSAYATSIAFGDVDGDGLDEVGIARKHGSNERYWILDDANHNFATLFRGGSGWGSSAYATSIAFGDVDGDGLDEVGISRKHGSNERYWVLDDANHNFNTLLSGGSGWGSSAYATSIAFGDVDGDGRDEVGISRKHGSNERYWVLDDANHNFNTLLRGGSGWGSSAYATSIAFGDVDGDGRDEVGISRKHGSNERYWLLDDANHNFNTLLRGGSGWGSSAYATSIAFGDVDGDGRDEVGISRKHGSNERYWLLDDFNQNFNTLLAGGTNWGSSTYATSIAFGDVDGDNKAELGVARKSSSNNRYWVMDDFDDDPAFGRSFWYYWFHNEMTKLDPRPFSGLHMVTGFRTNFTVVIYHWGRWRCNDGEGFLKKFANNLDSGTRVIDAWLDAVGDKLSFSNGNNRGAVIYLYQYENDTINTVKNDYIHGHPEYNNKWIDYWE